ncbi:MAG: FkbM family methyltransferase [Fervidobacterium sp.]
MRYTDKLSAEQVLLGGVEKLAYYRPKKADVVIDVGAFVGLYSLKAAKAVKPEGSVVAVEPNPIAFAWLCEKHQIEQHEQHNISL